MTVEELKRGQQELCRRLYAPKAFAERLLANLYRFHDVRYRPEAVTWKSLHTLYGLAKMYGRQGWAASRFFWSILWKTFWHSPRSLPQMINLLGMYQHFCKLLSQDVAWDPWAPATPEPKIHSSRVSVSDGLSRVGHDVGAVEGRAKFVPHANCPSGPSPGTAPQTLSAASRTP
jgi:hypothetical protein